MLEIFFLLKKSKPDHNIVKINDILTTKDHLAFYFQANLFCSTQQNKIITKNS